MANPVWTQMKTTMRKNVFQGPLSRNWYGSWPSQTRIWLSRPICWMSPMSALYSYMKRQISPAPTNEIAIGRKIRPLARASTGERSTTTAYSRPRNVAAIGTTSTQMKVFTQHASAGRCSSPG